MPDTPVVSPQRVPANAPQVPEARPDHRDDRFAMAPPFPTAPFPPGSGPARAMLPLQGLTVLAVEDSRFASDAMRLMCQRSGARLRRADTLEGARAHLRLYRPDVVIVDLGLPDGRGEDLIRDLAAQIPQGSVVIGTSGAPEGRALALQAGAQGFLDKPVASVAAFQAVLLAHLPDRSGVPGDDLRPPSPDPLALAEDLAHAARLIAEARDPRQHRYVAGFVGGLARYTQDRALEAAARSAANGADDAARLATLLRERLEGANQPFSAG